MGHCILTEPHARAPSGPSGTDLPAGDSPPPPAPRVGAADRVFGAHVMAPVRARLYAEHGGAAITPWIVDRAEIRLHKVREASVRVAETRCGGDIDLLVVKSEGKGPLGGSNNRNSNRL